MRRRALAASLFSLLLSPVVAAPPRNLPVVLSQGNVTTGLPLEGGHSAISEAAGAVGELCKEMRQNHHWAPVSSIRLELLQTGADQLVNQTSEDIDAYLRLFLVCRKVFWSYPVTAGQAVKIRALEGAILNLAQTSGKKLELERLGPATAETLKNDIAGVLPLSQALLQEIPSDGRQDLVRLQDALTKLHQALEQGGESTPSWNTFNASRVQFLVSQSRLIQVETLAPFLLKLQAVTDHGREIFLSR